MALDPGEVEVKLMGCSGWSPFRLAMNFKHADIRNASFRRARPRKSRVQDMAEASNFREPFKRYIYAEGCGDAIRAVCEYLRKDGFGETVDNIEREFMEPR